MARISSAVGSSSRPGRRTAGERAVGRVAAVPARDDELGSALAAGFQPGVLVVPPEEDDAGRRLGRQGADAADDAGRVGAAVDVVADEEERVAPAGGWAGVTAASRGPRGLRARPRSLSSGPPSSFRCRARYRRTRKRTPRIRRPPGLRRARGPANLPGRAAPTSRTRPFRRQTMRVRAGFLLLLLTSSRPSRAPPTRRTRPSS